MGAPSTQPRVIECLLANGEGDYTAEFLCKATGLANTQIRSAMGKIVQDNKLPGLTVISRGRIWHYDPSAAKVEPEDDEPQWFQEIARTSKGQILARGEYDQTLYVLTPLEV
jgi:hypothetical protein